MSGMLDGVKTLTSQSKNRYTIKKLLAAGGQGEVYDVVKDDTGAHYALKWYFKNSATAEQREILENLVLKGSPDASFLWPQDIIYYDGSFGYIMDLRGKNFRSIYDMMGHPEEVNPSFEVLCRAGFNLTKGYQKLHMAGYSYRDISFGNMFFDPKNGDVLICDNDNISADSNDNSGVDGTVGFMAPEVMRGEARPSRWTDLYSLAVLLFHMFFVSHPLEGRLEAQIRCWDQVARKKLYGYDPVFIFDPKDTRNRPVRGIHDNAILFWGLYPKSFKDLFTQTFTVGLTKPNARVTENKWLEGLANLRSGIMVCPKCGAKLFYDESLEKQGVAHTCWNCGKTVPVPDKLVTGKCTVILTDGAQLKSHHIYNDFDMDTVVGTVVHNPKNRKMLGIRNEDKVNWTYVRTDGSQLPVPIGGTAAIVPGCKIYFSNCTGEFC